MRYRFRLFNNAKLWQLEKEVNEFFEERDIEVISLLPVVLRDGALPYLTIHLLYKDREEKCNTTLTSEQPCGFFERKKN